MTQSIFRLRFEALLIALIGLLGLNPVWSAELLELVGDDVAICWRLQRAKEHGQQLERSELAARLMSSSFYSAWHTGDDFRKLQEAEATLRTLSGKPVRTMVEELFGSDVVVAIKLHPTTHQPSVLMLLSASNSSAIQEALKLWNQLDQWDSTSLQHRNRDYVKLTKPNRRESLFYALLDATLILTHDEDLLRKSLELHMDGKTGSFAAHPDIQAALKRSTNEDVLTMHLNPRACDAVLAGEQHNWPPLAKGVWKKTRWLSARVSLPTEPNAKNALRSSVVLDYDNAETPDWWQRLIANHDAANVTTPTSSVPETALFAVTGRVRSAGFHELLKASQSGKPLPKEVDRGRRIARGLLLGLDPLDDVLPQIGQQWTAAIVPRTNQESGFPVDGLFVLELKPIANSGKQAVPVALDNGLNAVLNMIAATQNAKDPRELAIVNQKVVDGTTIRSVSPLGAFSPSAAVTKDLVIISSSSELCEQYLTELKSRSAATTQTGTADSVPVPSQRCVANVKAMRTLLEQRRDWFIKQALRDQVSEAEATRRLKDADELLGLLDGAEMAFFGNDKKLEVTFGLSAESRQSR